MNVSKLSKGYNKVLPLTYDKNQFGIIKNGFVETINMDGCEINFTDFINKYTNKKIDKFNSNTDFYIRKVDDHDVIITVNNENETNHINVYNKNV